jgi:phospholipid/cholesterol/gamma-HCH transport system ATP-binding protein
MMPQAIIHNILEKTTATTISVDDAIIIHIEGLQKSFGDKQVLTNISLQVKKGENVVILGKSGEGKSVTIKCIVGMIIPDAGVVEVFGKDVFALNTDELKEVRQKIGFLFQSGALYDSMSVKENLAFALKRVLHITDEAVIDAKIDEVLQSVGLIDAIDKMPAELSGGMRKRIALARTLIVNPEIILYDEPTTGLDAITSREISELILQMQKKYHTTSIIITHDMKCAEIVGDRILIIKDGAFAAEGDFETLKHSTDTFINSFFI